MYDVAIIGAGLAGLAAASRLSGYKVALLEKEERPGGRVLSRHCDGTAYDLGALFASQLPFPESTSHVVPPSSEPVSLLAESAVWRGASPLACLQDYAQQFPGYEHELGAFLRGKKVFEDVPLPLAKAISAFWGLIHPAPIQGSLPERQCDGLRPVPAFRQNGNGAVVDQLMNESRADFFPGTNVVALRDRQAWFDLVIEDGKIRRARTVIMAIPPAPAALLLGGKTPFSGFLKQVRFYPGLSLVFSVSKRSISDFSYLVSLEGPFNSAVKCERRDKTFVHVYCLGERWSAGMAQGRETLLKDIGDRFSHMDVIDSPRALSFVDAASWAGIGPHISSPPYGAGVLDSSRIADRLFVAGDYTWFDAKEKMPYGMRAAVLSGFRAAEEVVSLLSGGVARGLT